MADVQLIQSQRLTDNADGGGLSTGDEVVDGQVGNLFSKVSRIDRVNGDLSLRKVFVQAVTADTDLFSGLHLIILAPPLDPRVDVLIFETNSWSDERDDAKRYVERFLDESVITRMIPYDRQLAEQRAVIVYQRPELSLPEIGEVYVLKNDGEVQEEFFRIQDIDHEEQTFTDEESGQDFKARVITMTISQPLTQEFSGSQPNRRFRAGEGKSVIRKTIASDAARYRGTVALAADADPGDLVIDLASVYGQLVPAATSESAVTDASPAGVVIYPASANADVSVGYVTGGATPYYTARSILPGSVVVDVTGGRVEDDGAGNLVVISGFVFDEGGTVDYQTGAITLAEASGGNSGSITYRPAAALARSALSFQLPVSISTRGYIYIASLLPIPTVGTLVVSYRALGKWYELADDGTGALIGDAGTGVGTINYTTGTAQVTLGALPDIGSSIIFAWGGDSELEIRTGDVNITPPRIELILANELEPDSLSLSWTAGAVAQTATCNAAGVISGDAVGYVETDTRRVVFRPDVLPDDNSTVTASYGDYAEAYAEEGFTPTESGGELSMTLADPPKEGTVSISATYFRDGNQSEPFTFLFKDDAAGNLISQGFETPAEITSAASVNYVTGEIILPATITYSSGRAVYEQVTDALPGRTLDGDTGQYRTVATPRLKAVGEEISAGSWPFNDSGVGLGGTVTIRYVDETASVGSPYEEEFDMPALKIDLTPGISNTIVPGGLMFDFGGRRYVDRAGALYHTVVPATGAATAAGSINYDTGEVSITDYASNVSPALSIKALLTEINPLPFSVVHARTPGSPLRPGSFFLQANLYTTGALVTAIADNNGNIDTANMRGYIDVTTGVFSVAFGGYVLDSSLSAEDKAEPWYDAANVDGGYIWRPAEVTPGTVRFNCVVQTALPLDPEIIGVNPVRLPSDGRVQIIRAGDTLVFHDTQSEALTNPAVAGATDALARGDLSSLVIYDDEGLVVDSTLYTVDLVAGSITWDDPLDLGAYTQPLVCLHTIEQMALCTDAQITGEVTIADPLTIALTADNSFCSSALIVGPSGDVQARIENLFAQNTWTNVWDDELIGDPPVSGAQFNDVTYPLAVTNLSAITQRWRLQFTSSGGGNIVAEELGVLGTFTTGVDVAPVNPATGLPYFTLDNAGFGTGWATGNLIRFNTVAAGGPVWFARATKSGPASFLDDRAKVHVRWDKD